MDAHTAPRPTLLVVEDDDQIRALLSLLLPRLGFQAQAVAGGSEAVEALRHGDVAAALVDWRLGEEDGLETVAALRLLAPGLPCCLMSGQDDVPEEGPGVACVLRKPFSVGQLGRALQQLTGGPGAR
ncbi:MAG: response regulator [Gemmataceae bacterium]|nr:response regulator [Gemmataceae bacterium]